MKKQKQNKTHDFVSFLIIAVVAYATYNLNVAWAKAMELNASRSAQNALEQQINSMSVPELIDYIAPQYGADKELIKTIVCAESNFEILPHDGNKGTNVTGIWDSTFKGWLTKYEKETGQTLNIDSQFDQISLMSWAFSKGDEYRYQWSTYHAYMNGGHARIWSRYYGKYINVSIPKNCKN